jgi:hypothetical protein
MIIILSGEPGNGKTYQSMFFDEQVVVLDLENRDEPTRARYFKDRMIKVIPIKQINDEFANDYAASYFELERQIENIKQNHDEIGTVVVDGISDIRNKYSKHKWLSENPTRKNPRMEEWTLINNDTSKLLEPLINMARYGHIDNLVLTAQMKDNYNMGYEQTEKKLIKVSMKDGRIPATQDWQDYDVDVIINLQHPQKKTSIDLSKYIASCTKSPVGAWEEDITGKCLYDLLIEMGL